VAKNHNSDKKKSKKVFCIKKMCTFAPLKKEVEEELEKEEYSMKI